MRVNRGLEMWWLLASPCPALPSGTQSSPLCLEPVSGNPGWPSFLPSWVQEAGTPAHAPPLWASYSRSSDLLSHFSSTPKSSQLCLGKWVLGKPANPQAPPQLSTHSCPAETCFLPFPHPLSLPGGRWCHWCRCSSI